MANNSPFLRPLGIAAGVLGIVQSLTWGILSLLGILVYTKAMDGNADGNAAVNEFQNSLVEMYFNNFAENPIVACLEYGDIMTPGKVVIWTSIYFGTSVIWLVFSCFQLYDSCRSNFNPVIVIGWVTVTAVVAAIDFAGAITFGVDYNTLQDKPLFDCAAETTTTEVSDNPAEIDAFLYNIPSSTNFLLPPIFMMTMCARGFILWIINVGLVIYLSVAATNLLKKGSPNLSQKPGNLSRHQPYNTHPHDSFQPSMYGPPKEDPFSQGRQNPTFQPDPTHSWDDRSPTVGNQQPSQRDFAPRNSPNINDVVNPIPPIPRVAKAVPTPLAFLPTPQPDYSPPMQRSKREPYMQEAPMRSALKKPNAQGYRNF